MVASEGVEASVRALLLPMLDPLVGPWPTSSSSSPTESAGVLTQGLRQIQDPEASAKV